LSGGGLKASKEGFYTRCLRGVKSLKKLCEGGKKSLFLFVWVRKIHFCLRRAKKSRFCPKGVPKWKVIAESKVWVLTKKIAYNIENLLSIKSSGKIYATENLQLGSTYAFHIVLRLLQQQHLGKGNFFTFVQFLLIFNLLPLYVLSPTQPPSTFIFSIDTAIIFIFLHLRTYDFLRHFWCFHPLQHFSAPPMKNKQFPPRPTFLV